MADFLTENRITVIGHTCAVHLTPGANNGANNSGEFHGSDEFRITINTADNGGQELVIGGRPCAFVSFTVVGGWELGEIMDGLANAYEKLLAGTGGCVENLTEAGDE